MEVYRYPPSFLLKNKLHLKPHELADFRLVSAIPLYLSFVFGFIRDTWDARDPRRAHRTIGEIAFAWGFSDLSHFGRRFKAEFGVSPGEYRRRER